MPYCGYCFKFIGSPLSMNAHFDTHGRSSRAAPMPVRKGYRVEYNCGCFEIVGAGLSCCAKDEAPHRTIAQLHERGRWVKRILNNERHLARELREADTGGEVK